LCRRPVFNTSGGEGIVPNHDGFLRIYDSTQPTRARIRTGQVEAIGCWTNCDPTTIERDGPVHQCADSVRSTRRARSALCHAQRGVTCKSVRIAGTTYRTFSPRRSGTRTPVAAYSSGGTAHTRSSFPFSSSRDTNSCRTQGSVRSLDSPFALRPPSAC